MIDFSASWCGPCKRIGPLIESFAEQYATSVQILAVDVDEQEDIANHFQITSIPTFVFYQKGQEIDRIVGANPSSIENKINVYKMSSSSIIS